MTTDNLPDEAPTLPDGVVPAGEAQRATAAAFRELAAAVQRAEGIAMAAARAIDGALGATRGTP